MTLCLWVQDHEMPVCWYYPGGQRTCRGIWGVGWVSSPTNSPGFLLLTDLTAPPPPVPGSGLPFPILGWLVYFVSVYAFWWLWVEVSSEPCAGHMQVKRKPWNSREMLFES